MTIASGEISRPETTSLWRRAFVARFQAFLHRNYDNPNQVARTLGVDYTTARSWWHGETAPQGWVVGRVMGDPDGRRRADALTSLTEGPCATPVD